MRISIAAVAGPAAVVLLASALLAQEHEGCPMHGGHEHQATVDHRHQEATGLASDGVVHHFILGPEGGAIRLEVKDGTETAARDQVRAHLQSIARAFAAGDFSLPARIHGQVPPGVEAMKAHASGIRYSYAETANGATVTIATADPDALAAVHEFLRFQIGDHATGDPLQ